MRKALLALAVFLGGYLVFRAIAEPFTIDLSDPASYAHDWGGPSLAGVLLVHCGPGVVSAVLLWRGATRGRRRSQPEVDAQGGVEVGEERGGEAAHPAPDAGGGQ